jgi:hypothetical protein
VNNATGFNVSLPLPAEELLIQEASNYSSVLPLTPVVETDPYRWLAYFHVLVTLWFVLWYREKIRQIISSAWSYVSSVGEDELRPHFD